MSQIEEILARLSPRERDWLTTTKWGSWVVGVGKDLHCKGLATQDGLSATTLGQQVRSHILETERRNLNAL